MVCPKCGMKIVGARSECKYCGAPIPAELGGKRPDPIFDDSYDWLRADEIKEAAEQSANAQKVVSRRMERETEEQEKLSRKEQRELKKQEKAAKRAQEETQEEPAEEDETTGGGGATLMLVCMAMIVVAVVAVLAGLYLKWGVTIPEDDPKEPKETVEQLSNEGEEETAEETQESAGEVEAEEETPAPVEEAAEETPAPETEPEKGNYLLPDSNTRQLTIEDLEGLTQEECCLARNEIYARHGYIYHTQGIRDYLDSTGWYEPTVSGADFDEDVFNEFEAYNAGFILQYEKDTWGGSYY